MSKTDTITCKSWIYDKKKTLYELKRVQALLKMIIDQILARPNIGYLKIDFLKNRVWENAKLLNRLCKVRSS